MMQKGFYFDQTRCTGCYACIVACEDWHDVPAGPAKWMRVSRRDEGRYPKISVSWLATPCYHCAEPVCSYICPNEAISKRDEDGIVVVDRDKCRGEHACGIISPASVGHEYLYGSSEAPCQITCPAHLYIPGYVALIAKGKFKESLDLIRRRMPLPSVCGRVCLNPCETECRRKDVDKPVPIEALKRFVTDNVSEPLPNRVPQTQEDKIAIIGSGPAGLAAAYDLIRMGYGVTIFEAQSVIGGMLSLGIPQHRLPRAVLKRDIDYIQALGVEIKTNTQVNLDGGFKDLFKQGFGAIMVAIGAQKGLKLNIPNADIAGVLVSTSFMHDVNTKNKVKVGKKVIVVGGGNVAMDCARSARRLGAAEVRIVCLEDGSCMPAEASEVEQAEQEGIKLNMSLAITEIIGDKKVTGVKCKAITGLWFDKGVPRFEMVKGSESILPADTVIFAIGQSPDLAGLSADGAIKASKSGTIVADGETMMTGHRGIFAAGDCVNGATSVIDAIANGQKAAFYINRYLQGEGLRIKQKKTVKAADIKVDIVAGTEKQEIQPMPLLAVKDRISNFKEVAQGFNMEAAIAEAKRCLNCAGHLCKDVCPYDAPQFADEEKAKMQKCDLCLERWPEKKPVCVNACIMRALDAGPLEEMKKKYGENQSARGFEYSGIAQPSVVQKKQPPKRW